MNYQYLKFGFLIFFFPIISCISSTSRTNVKLIHTIPLEFDSFYIGFNPKSDMFYYKGRLDGKFVLVVNGEILQETIQNAKFGDLTLARNAFGFFHGDPGNRYLRINKNNLGPFSGVVEVESQLSEIGSISPFESNGEVIFDRTGKHFCFVAQDKDGSWVLVKDGKKEDLSRATLSTKQLERKRSRQDRKMEIFAVEHTLDIDKIFPEGLNDAYGEANGLIFREGKLIPSNVKVLHPVLDPGSIKVNGYSLHVKGYGPPQFSSGCPKYFSVFYNDHKIANYKHQSQTNPVSQLMLSIDGKHYAYLLKKVDFIKGRKTFKVVVDGHAGPEFDFIGSMRFEGNRFFYSASKGRNIYTCEFHTN